MRNRCSYNADDVHIFASVPLSPAPLPDPVPCPRPVARGPVRRARKSSRNPPRNPTAKYDHTRQSRPAFHAHDHAHDTPARTIHPVKIAVSDGSAVTGRQYRDPMRDPCVRGVSRSLGRWGVEQAATKNKHLGVPGRPSGWTCREVSTLVCRVHGRVWTVRRECRVERSRVACRLSRVVAGAPVSTPRIGYDY